VTNNTKPPATEEKKPAMSKEDELYSKKLLETFKQLADADK
jgi:hypothetical protein